MGAAALPIVALAMTAASQMAEGIGANSEARAAARADDENARLSLLSGEQDAEQIMRDERMMAGDSLSMMGASGLALGSGSAADLLMESARQANRDIRITRARSAAESANYRQSAKDKRKAGRNALIGAAFGTVATALGGASAIRNDARANKATQKNRNNFMKGIRTKNDARAKKATQKKHNNVIKGIR